MKLIIKHDKNQVFTYTAKHVKNKPVKKQSESTDVQVPLGAKHVHHDVLLRHQVVLQVNELLIGPAVFLCFTDSIYRVLI